MSLIPTPYVKEMRNPYKMDDGATGFNSKILFKIVIVQCNPKLSHYINHGIFAFCKLQICQNNKRKEVRKGYFLLLSEHMKQFSNLIFNE